MEKALFKYELETSFEFYSNSFLSISDSIAESLNQNICLTCQGHPMMLFNSYF